MKSYFIVGTDTDCGKTYTTCELVKLFKNQHQRVLAIKPLVSGCNDQFMNEDITRLQAANQTSQQICNWQFKLPVSPHLAAFAENIEISAHAINQFCQQYTDLDYLLIEGAGGLMVPLNEQETWIDFLKISQIPVILVVGMRLGCLNHALLTAFALEANQIPCVGWVANCLDDDMLLLAENIQTLQQKITAPLLGHIPYKGELKNLGFSLF